MQVNSEDRQVMRELTEEETEKVSGGSADVYNDKKGRYTGSQEHGNYSGTENYINHFGH